VSNTGLVYRVDIDGARLELALEKYAQFPANQPAGVISGSTRSQQAELFRRFVINVLSRSMFGENEFRWPDIFWRSLPQNTQRPMDLGEVVLSANTHKVYFWGYEIGTLGVVSLSDVEPFCSSDAVEHRYFPHEEDLPQEYPDGG